MLAAVLDSSEQRGERTNAVRRRLRTMSLLGAVLGLLITAASDADPARAARNGPLLATQHWLYDCPGPEVCDPFEEYLLWRKRPGQRFERLRGATLNTDPVPSPTGRAIVYADLREDSDVPERLVRSELLTRPLSGRRLGPARPLRQPTEPAWTAHSGSPIAYGWSPDGRSLAVMSTRAPEGSAGPAREIGLTTQRVDGSDRREVLCDCPTPQSELAWARRGRIAYLHDNALYLVSTQGGRARRLSGGFDACDSPYLNSEYLQPTPAWSPDGRQLAYPCGKAIVTVDIARHRRRRLSNRQMIDNPDSVAWSPDGRFLAFAVEGARSRLVVMRTDGSRVRRVRLPRALASIGVGISGLTWVRARRGRPTNG
jgi:Tol biopolymer transport system component